MNARKRIDNLVRRIKARLPGVALRVDAPSRAAGDWFVDVGHRGQSFTVEYRPKLGFGLSSTPADGYGEGPDEFLGDETSLLKRLVQLTRARRRTEPERVRLLRELRAGRRVTQNELAERLGIRQPTVSTMERREDVSLSTLRRYVEALGGELRVSARFGDEMVEIKLGG